MLIDDSLSCDRTEKGKIIQLLLCRSSRSAGVSKHPMMALGLIPRGSVPIKNL